MRSIAALMGGEEAPPTPDGGEPALVPLPREQYRGRISAEGVVELPETLQRGKPGNQT